MNESDESITYNTASTASVINKKGPLHLIFDDSADLHRAIAISDIYYGDKSSLVPLFQQTGKPIMLSTVAQPQGNRATIITSFAVEGDCIWFHHHSLNCLIQVNYKTHQVELIESTNHLVKENKHLTNVVEYFNGRLFLPQKYKNELVLFDIHKHSFNVFEFPQLDRNSRFTDSIYTKFNSICVWRNKVILIPHAYPGVLIFDTETNTFLCCNDFIEELDEIFNKVSKLNYQYGYFINACTGDNQLILPCRFSNAVVVVDLMKVQSNIYYIGEEDNEFSQCCSINGFVYLTERRGCIYKFNVMSGEYWIIHRPTFKKIADHSLWSSVIVHDDAVWVFGQYINQVIRIDIETNAVDEVKALSSNYCYSETITRPLSNINILFARSTGKHIIGYTAFDDSIIVFDSETSAVDRFSINIPKGMITSMYRGSFKNQIVSEKNINGGTLEDFIDYNLLYSNVFETDKGDGLCGKRIYDYIKSLIE